MAKFRPSAIVQAISGRVGGINFAQGKNGNIIRAISQRQNSTHETQLRNKAWISSAMKSWEDDVLTKPLTLQFYINFASNLTNNDALGLPRNPTARELYIHLYFRETQRFGSPLQPPRPVRPTSTPIQITSFTASIATGLNLTFTSDAPLFSERIIIFLARSFRKTAPKQFRAYRLSDPPLNPQSPINLTQQWENLFGALVLDEAISIRVLFTEFSTTLGMKLWSTPAIKNATVTA